MRRFALVLLLLILCVSWLHAGEYVKVEGHPHNLQVEIVSAGCFVNLRSAANKTAPIIEVVNPKDNGTYKVLQTFADYYLVFPVTSKSITSDGYVWQEMLELTNEPGTFTVKSPGVIVRSKPHKQGDNLGAYWPGAVVKLKDKFVTWYLIEYKGKQGWVSAFFTKVKQKKQE